MTSSEAAVSDLWDTVYKELFFPRDDLYRLRGNIFFHGVATIAEPETCEVVTDSDRKEAAALAKRRKEAEAKRRVGIVEREKSARRPKNKGYAMSTGGQNRNRRLPKQLDLFKDAPGDYTRKELLEMGFAELILYISEVTGQPQDRLMRYLSERYGVATKAGALLLYDGWRSTNTKGKR
jgi:hypothetical protein